jgi:hypothetical protein
MTRAPDFIAEDTVQPPSHPDPVPLAPEGCETDWKTCLDAGHDAGPTTAHADADWRAIDTARP